MIGLGRFNFANVSVLTEEHFALRCDEMLPSLDPLSHNELERRDDRDQWLRAMDDEMESLRENDTWCLVDRPKGCRPIQTKWVYKTKRDSSGEVVKFKARLVAKGFTQRFGIDYDETYSPVVRYTSVRMLIAYAAQFRMRIHQMDVVTAFLQGDVDTELYMEQPVGYDDGSGRVCRLKRSIYGLKQAGRQWNLKLDDELKYLELKQSLVEPCIYYAGDLSIIVGIYVDDFLIVYSDVKVLHNFKKMVTSKFKMKDMGEGKGCIGMRINQHKNGIDIDQSIYVGEVLKRFGMNDCNPLKNPSDMSSKLTKDLSEGSCMDDGPIPYQEAVGCLLFITQATRPDILHAVHYVSRFNNCYCRAHWLAVKRIMRYLKGTTDYRLRFTSKRDSSLVGFVDADWATDTDTRCSVTGYVFTLYGGNIVWRSTKQKAGALSSTEAEYIALSAAAQEAMCTRQLTDELGMTRVENPVKINCDSQGAIKLALVGAFRPKTRHIDIRHHFIRDLVNRKAIVVEYVPTGENVADVFTKTVPVAKLIFCNRKMGCF